MTLLQERIIERLKEQREREDRERLEETESYKRENKDLKERVTVLQTDLTEKEVCLYVSLHTCTFVGHLIPLFPALIPLFLYLSISLSNRGV